MRYILWYSKIKLTVFYKTYINKHFNFKIYKTTVQIHHREQLPGSEAGFLLLVKAVWS